MRITTEHELSEFAGWLARCWQVCSGIYCIRKPGSQSSLRSNIGNNNLFGDLARLTRQLTATASILKAMGPHDDNECLLQVKVKKVSMIHYVGCRVVAVCKR